MFKNLSYAITYFFFTIFVSFGIYFLTHETNLINSDHYICTEINEYKTHNNFVYKFPFSCDEDNYYEGFRNPMSIIERNHPYQSRPLYITSVFLISNLIDLFIPNQNNLPIAISVIINHILIFSFSIYFLKKSLIKEKLSYTNLILISFLLLNPIFKWGLFLPSNQTLSFLLITLLFYIFKKHNEIQYYLFPFLLGVLILGYRPIALAFIVYAYLKLKNNKKDFKNIFGSSVIFLTPWVLYDQFIKLRGFQPFDDLAITWGQFRWLQNYAVRPVNFLSQNLLEKPILEWRNYNSEWHCTTLPENFICYLQDTIDLFIYMGLPILFTIIYFFKFRFLENKELKIILNIFLIVYFFYSLIGWYPPLRFNLYSFSNVLFLFLGISLISHKTNKNFYILFSGVLIYFLGLNHWNSFDILEINTISTLGILIMLFSVLNDLKFLKKPVF